MEVTNIYRLLLYLLALEILCNKMKSKNTALLEQFQTSKRKIVESGKIDTHN
jgi:hypothetical protein